jgi:putative transposase
MAISEEVLDKLLENYQKPEDILGENGLLKQLTKGLLERAQPEWQQQENHQGGQRRDRTGGAARPAIDIRAKDRTERADAFSWL